ncbi:MAG: GNAT family N-acetyltransferase [Dehalococcoidia bacterium]|nr:GNAT family N-acetyltransferase [Dehalococcoidia bacterium]
MAEQNAIAAPEGFTVRPPREQDLEAVTALMRSYEEEFEGEPEAQADDVRMSWRRARFDLERDAWIIAAPDGSIAGYADVWDRDPGRDWHVDGYVHRDYRGRGAGRALVRLSERRACERSAPAGRAVIWNIVAHTDEAGRRLLEEEAYHAERLYWRMVIDLQSEPPESAPPPGVTIRTLALGQDEREVYEVVQDASSDGHNYVRLPYEEWAQLMFEREGFDPALFFVATADARIVGVALCPEAGWVRQVAVRREWRRRGVAGALLRHAFREFYRRGTRRAGLVVDSYNRTGARRVYEAAGMRQERQHDWYMKVLRQ